MKVNAWKNIDIETEVDVSLDDCINEMLDIANSEDGWRRKFHAIDGATKILEKIDPDTIGEALAKYPPALALIRQRLQKWIDAT
jgi:hypothetical protein